MNCPVDKPLIELYIEDTLDINLTTEAEDGTPFDITSYDVRFVVIGTSINKTTVNGGIVKTDATAGKSRVHIASADTTGLPVGYPYEFEAEVYRPGEQFTFLRGTFRVL